MRNLRSVKKCPVLRERCLRTNNLTVAEKLDLADVDLLADMDLLGNGANRLETEGLFNKHKKRYAKIQKRLTEGEKRGNDSKFLTKYGLGPEGYFLSGTL